MLVRELLVAGQCLAATVESHASLYENDHAIRMRLHRREILVDWRPQAGVRFSPHFYNTIEEIDMLLNALEEIKKPAQTE